MDKESMAILSSNSFNAYILAILIFGIGAVTITIVNRILKKKVDKLSQKPKFQVLNFAYSIFKKTFFPLIYYGFKSDIKLVLSTN